MTSIPSGFVYVSDSGNEIVPVVNNVFNNINKYIVGNIVVLSAKFLDATNTLIDPTTVTLYVRNPDYTVNTFVYNSSDIVKNGVGLYSYNLPNIEYGYYTYRFEGAGNVVCAQNGQIESVATPIGSL
jgi:hypothetical protein